MSSRKASFAARLRAALAPVQARWAQASVREQRLLSATVALLALALVWFVALRPALTTLRTAQTQGPLLRTQLQSMLQLQAQAQLLQTQAQAPAAQPKEVLASALGTLGPTASLSLQGERATVTLEGSSADALAQWLTEVRLNMHARPVELHLSQSQGLWSGSVVLQLPHATAP